MRGLLSEGFRRLLVTMSHRTLGIVRIAFYTITLLEWLQLTWIRPLSLALPEPASSLLMLLLLAATVGMIAGYRLEYTAPINYVLVLYVQEYLIDHYHIDYMCVGMALLFVLAPPPPAKERLDEPVPYWLFLLLFSQIALVYFDSLFYKYQSVVWLRGTVFWMAAALPNFSYGAFPDALESEPLLKGMTYSALFLETVFPLMLLRPFRTLLWPIGFGLHLGIAVFFPIPFFGLAVCALYLMFIDWSTVHRWTQRATPAESAPREVSPVPPPGRSWRDRLGPCLIALLIVSQAMVIWERALPVPSALGWAFTANRMSMALTGVAENPVYVDYHFTVRAPILTYTLELADGRSLHVPSFDEKCYPDVPFVTGRVWVLNNFFTRFGHFLGNQSVWVRYIAGWCKIQGLSLHNARVKVSYHLITVPIDRLDVQTDDRIESEPWQEAGVIVFDAAGRPAFHWRPEFTALYER